MSCPLVSVVIPAFNAEATLGETLRSVAAQHYRPIEVLVVDDGSTDGTGKIAQAFFAGTGLGRVISTSNSGVAAARNRGIAAARGEFVAPIDADDLWHPTYLTKLVAKAVGSAIAPALVFSGFRLIDADGMVLASGALTPIEGPAALRMALCNLVGNGSAMLIGRAAAIAAGGYDERLRAARAEGCEDYLLQMILAARHPILSVTEYLVGYRHLDGRMSGDSERMFRSGRLAEALFAETCPVVAGAIPVWARRWSQSRRRLALARQRIARGRVIGAAVLFAQAVWLDPVGTAATGVDRAGRLVRKLVGSERRARTRAFHDIDPADPDPLGTATRDGWLQRLQRTRAGRTEQMEGAAPRTGRAAVPAAAPSGATATDWNGAWAPPGMR